MVSYACWLNIDNKQMTISLLDVPGYTDIAALVNPYQSIPPYLYAGIGGGGGMLILIAIIAVMIAIVRRRRTTRSVQQ